MMEFIRMDDEQETVIVCPNCGFVYTREQDILSIMSTGCCEECLDELVESGVIQVGNSENY